MKTLTSHDSSLLSEYTQGEQRVLEEAHAPVCDVSLEDRLSASVWFGAHRPEYHLVDTWTERSGEIRVAVCLKAPSIGQQSSTEIFRLVRSEPVTFQHIGSEV